MANIYKSLHKEYTGGSADDPEFNQRSKSITTKMLRTAFDYANTQPDEVYVYMQIENGNAGANCLFRINEQLCEAHNLNEVGLEDYEFDVSAERQQQLMGFMAEGIRDFIDLYVNAGKSLPSEVWMSINVTKDEQKTVLGYRLPGAPALLPTWDALQKWKVDLDDPGFQLVKDFETIDRDYFKPLGF